MKEHAIDELGREIDLACVIQNENEPGNSCPDRVKTCWVTRLIKWMSPKKGAPCDVRTDDHDEESHDTVTHLLAQMTNDHHNRRNGSSLEVDVSSGHLPKMTIRITMDMGAILDVHQERQIRSVLSYLESSMPVPGHRVDSPDSAGIKKDIPFFDDLFGLIKRDEQQ